jgi:hypothetical protein
VEGGLLLNVVVGEGAAVPELFASEDQALLVGRLLVLDVHLDIIDGVGRLDFKSDCLAHDVIVGEGLAVLELFASEDRALLVGRLLVLDVRLDVIDGVGRSRLLHVVVGQCAPIFEKCCWAGGIFRKDWSAGAQ